MVKKRHDLFSRVEGAVLGFAGNYVKEKVTKKLIKYGEISILVLLALIMFSFGLATLMGTYVPFLSNGLNFILLGVVFILASLIIR